MDGGGAPLDFYNLYGDHVSAKEDIVPLVKAAAERHGVCIPGGLFIVKDEDWGKPFHLNQLRREIQENRAGLAHGYATFQISLRPDYARTGGEYRNDDAYLAQCAERIDSLQRLCWDEGVNCYVETHVDRITEDPEAFAKIMDKAKWPIEVNGDVSHYLSRGITQSAHLPKILGAMGHTHQRMCRVFGDISANVDTADGGVAADWAAHGLTWQAFDFTKPGLKGGLSSRCIVGESGPIHLVSDPLAVDKALVPLYRAMARYADKAATGRAPKVDGPADWAL
eukprot:g3372.t1